MNSGPKTPPAALTRRANVPGVGSVLIDALPAHDEVAVVVGADLRCLRRPGQATAMNSMAC